MHCVLLLIKNFSSLMDVEAIANLFATSLSVDPNVRKAGEIDIRRVR